MKKTEQENMSGEITKFNPESLSKKFSSSIVEFTVQDNNGTLVVDSRVVAEMVDKRHDNLLRDIKNYEVQILTNSNLMALDFFIKSSYKDAKGEERESYLLTRKGCEFIANKMTGEKGALFTAIYTDKFHAEEQKLLEGESKTLSEEIQLLDQREVLGKQFKIYGTVDEPLFLAKDVAEWIEHSNSRMMLKSIDESEKVCVNNPYASSGQQEQWFLTEEGLYEVLMQSRKPIAKEFKKQVKIILKDIRKHGMYATNELLDNPDLLIQVATKLKEEKEKNIFLLSENKQQEKRINHLEPWANYSKDYLKSEDTVHVEILAKLLTKQGIDIGRTRLFKYLRDNGYVHVIEGYNVPTQKSINLEIMELEESFFYDQKGNCRTKRTTKITTKGEAYFYKKFSSAEQPHSIHGFQKIS